MPLPIVEIRPQSLAAKAGFSPGDTILTINSVPIRDFFDLEYYANDYQLEFELLDQQGQTRKVTVMRQLNKPLGIEPQAYQHRYCQNNCVFCFIDQLPSGMRKSLYKKDDDYLYSYVFGNYITLNNLTPEDRDRIIEQRISPLYISLHSVDNALRQEMMRYKGDFDVLALLRLFAEEGIEYHIQIVCVPGYNCGGQLRETLATLLNGDYQVLSIGIVPVGLTDHRDRLPRLQPFTPELARETIEIINAARKTDDIIYAADELYELAGIPLPGEEYYGDFPQLENGIGMLKLTELNYRKKRRSLCKELDRAGMEFCLITSKLAARILGVIADDLNQRLTRSKVRVQSIRNDYFGRQISVSGLLTASDILQQHDAAPGEALILPSNVFNHEGCTLDDKSQLDLKLELQRPLLVIDQFFDDWDWI